MHFRLLIFCAIGLKPPRTNGVIMSEVNKENEEKKKQGRKSEEGIIQIIFWKNIGGNKTTFSNRQLYNSFRLPMTLISKTKKKCFEISKPFRDAALKGYLVKDFEVSWVALKDD